MHKSALKPTGSTWQWRQLREPFEQHLQHSPIPCGKCGNLIHAGQPFDLGHSTARAHGGNDNNIWPEHTQCNRAEGGRLGNTIRKQKRADAETHNITPSRKW